MKSCLIKRFDYEKALLSIALMINLSASLYIASDTFVGQFVSCVSLCFTMLHVFLYATSKGKHKELLRWIVGLVVCFILYRLSRRREVFDLYVYTNFYGEKEDDWIAEVFCYTTLAFCGGVFALSLFGILPDAPLFYRGSVRRYTLGLIHPGAGGYLAYIISSALYVLSKRKTEYKTIFKLILLFLLDWVIFNNRATTICILIMICTCLIPYKKNKINYVTKKKSIYLIYLLPYFIMGILLLLSVRESDSQLLNRILSSRIENNYLFLNKYNIKLFGNAGSLTWIPGPNGWGERYLDSGYMQLMIYMGVLNTIIYFALWSKSTFNCIRDNEKKQVVLQVLLLLMLVVEASPMRWYFALPIFLNGKKGKISNEKESRNYNSFGIG